MAHVSDLGPIARPADEGPRPVRKRPSFAVALALALLVPSVGGAALVGGWAWHRFDSPSAAAAFLRGESLWIEPQASDVGPVSIGVEEALTLRVSNLTGRGIAINGGPGYCSAVGCVLTDLTQYPIEVAPWSTLELPLTYYVNEPRTRERAFQFKTSLFTSIGTREITINGTIRDDAASPLASATTSPEVIP